MAGYNEMKKRFKPKTIIHYGKSTDIAGEDIEIEAFKLNLVNWKKNGDECLRVCYNTKKIYK
ncbi:MAG: hypothetical protein J6M62_10470 [Selenomonadaceae bacterium]|nr:hypothetical protein [Selenomonadaceae bacterium]